jgi:hypothetical protein
MDRKVTLTLLLGRLGDGLAVADGVGLLEVFARQGAHLAPGLGWVRAQGNFGRLFRTGQSA